MTVDVRARLAAALRGELRFDEPMARHTSLKVGGPTDFFAVPADMADLTALMGVVIETGIPYLVVGGGNNLLVRDGGFRGVVISPAGRHCQGRAAERPGISLRDTGDGRRGAKHECGCPRQISAGAGRKPDNVAGRQGNRYIKGKAQIRLSSPGAEAG